LTGVSRKFEIFDDGRGANIPGYFAAGSIAMPIEPARLEKLSALARKVLWLSSWTIITPITLGPMPMG
jgi:hypothetical protein